MEISNSFIAWVAVLFIQVLVHIRVVYMRKSRDEDEPLLVESKADGSSDSSNNLSEDHFAKSPPPVGSDNNGSSVFQRKFLDPRDDDHDYDPSDPAWDSDAEDYDDDEPPNLQQRLSQTGSEMMSVSAAVGCWLLLPSCPSLITFSFCVLSRPSFIYCPYRAAETWRPMYKNKY